MNSERTNHWLTLGANFGVLIGILLLVYELAQNREMIRAQTRSEISHQISDRLMSVGLDSQAASVKRRAEAGETLTADENQQYLLQFQAGMRDWENIHYQYRNGLFDEVEFDAERRTWRILINRNLAFPANWCRIRQGYSPAFVAELESLVDGEICGSPGSE